MHSLKETREDLLNSSVWRVPYTQKDAGLGDNHVFCVTATSAEAVAPETLLGIVALVTGTSDLCSNFIQGEVNLPSGIYFKNPLGLNVQGT